MLHSKTNEEMKKFFILLSAALVSFALVSCQKEVAVDIDDEIVVNEPTGSVPFVLSASVAEPKSPTKTSLNTSSWAVDWEDGDIIYAVTADKLWGQDYNDDKTAESIAEFVYDEAEGKFTTAKTIADGEHTFNFLYSNGSQKSYHRGGSTSFSLATNQAFDVNNPTANLKVYDALAAQLTETTPATLAGITMDHLFTLMKVTIKNKTGASLTATKFEMTVDEGSYLYGVFNVTFGASPSVKYSKNGSNTIAVDITNGTIANTETIDVYFVMAPLTSYTGNITFKVTDSEDKIYSRTNTISSAISFAAGTYNTATHTLKTAADLYPTIDNSSSDYTTGFETGFTAGSTYNNTEVKIDGPDGGKWGSYYGTVTTTDKITGSNSLQMRWYTGSSSNLGYAETQFYLSNVGYVSFNATATNGLKAGLYYKRPSDGDWVLAQSFTPGTSSTKCAYAFETPIAKAQLRIGVVLPASNPTSTSRLTIDDVVVKATAPTHTITIDGGITNGTVTTSPSGTVLDGSVVTITATPDDGYALTSLTVTDDSDNEVTVTANTFTMPESNVTITATFARLYTISTSATNGSITVSPSTSVVAGTVVTITAVPDGGYSFISWDVTGATPASTTENPTTFTMPSSNVSVSASFGTAATYTVSLYCNGSKVKDVKVDEGDSILTEIDGEEDALTGPAGKSFLGWSTSNVPESISYITASTLATADIDLYAVFGEADSYRLVESDLSSAWAGDYLIAYSSTVFADGRVGGTGTGGIGKQYVKVDPSTHLSGKVIDAEWGDTYNVTLEEISSGSNTYVLKTKDNQYNYQTSNSNGLASSSNKATAANYPITVTFTSSSDIKLKLGGAADGAVFRYNTAEYFRYYKNGGQNAVYLYKRQAGTKLLTW